MKHGTFKTALIAGALLLAVPALAADYSNYSMQELSQMRGKMMDKSQEEKDAFRNAWRQKMQNATPEERAKNSRGRGQRMGHHYGQQGNCGNGNCGQSDYGKGHRKGMGNGQDPFKN